MSRKCLIIGNAPSFIGKNKGRDIDSFCGPIIRMCNCGWASKKDYGSRIDYFLVPMMIRRELLFYDTTIPNIESWVYFPEKKLFNRQIKIDDKYRKFKLINCEKEIDPWLDLYGPLEKKDKKYKKKFSSGCAAAIIVAQKLCIDEIYLGACDNLWLGKNDGYKHKTKNTPIYTPPHDFEAEKKLLKMVEERYDVQVRLFI